MWIQSYPSVELTPHLWVPQRISYDMVGRTDAGLRQYEDNKLTPAALSFFENVSRPGLHNALVHACCDDGRQPIHFACRDDHLEVAQWLFAVSIHNSFTLVTRTAGNQCTYLRRAGS